MTFSSPIFLFIFFPLVFLCYFLIPAQMLRVRNALLTAASLIFYGFGEPVAMFFSMMAVCSFILLSKFSIIASCFLSSKSCCIFRALLSSML